MKIVWALLCLQAELKPDSELSIKGEFADLIGLSFPFRISRFSIALRFWRTGSERKSIRDIAIRIDSPSGVRLSEHVVQLSQGADRAVYDFENQTFPTPGVYTFRIIANSEYIHAITLLISSEPLIQ